MPYQDGYLHYVDEGQGPVVLLLHGNPTWSYLYRNVIREMQNQCRMIAVDYPGFGFSKAPSNYRFTPAEHAEAVKSLIEHLGLKEFVLVVQDWGGPIGLSYAVENREKIRGLVVMNSWAWEASVPQKLFSLVMGGWPLGYWLQTRRNFFAGKIVPHGIFHKGKIDEQLRRAYTEPFRTTQSRVPTWVFPRQIRKSKHWLRSLESKLARLEKVPTQILWGKKDEPGFRPVEMKRWQKHLKAHETEILDDASHFVQEDRPDRVVAAIRRVLERASELKANRKR
jgi:haloalkane dehalogenase